MSYASRTSDDASKRARGVRWRRRELIGAWVLAAAVAALAIFPIGHHQLAKRRAEGRLARLEAQLASPLCSSLPTELDAALAMRVRQLGPFLSSWQTVGGCGAGGGGTGGGVKWIGRNTRGGLFQVLSQTSYVTLPKEIGKTGGGYNLISTNQFGREITEDVTLGVVIPILYKYYRNYFELDQPVDVSNGGLGDVNLVMTGRFGPIGATSITAGLGFPTGEHTGQYKMDYLTQEKQLGLGKYTGTLTADHVFDEIWGLMVVGGSLAYRGGTNELGSYRSPSASLYSHMGYFLGPFVPAGGLTLTGFWAKDKDRGSEQGTAVATAAASMSIEWSNDYMALLAGVSIPYGMNHWSAPAPIMGVPATPRFALQPWIASVGISLSPF